MAWRAKYQILSENGCVICEGSKSKICEYFNLRKDFSLAPYADNNLYLKGKYQVRITNKPGREEESEWQRHLDFLVWHLRVYKDCATVFDPEPYREELEKMGFKIKITEYWSYDMRTGHMNPKRKNRRKKAWIVSVEPDKESRS